MRNNLGCIGIGISPISSRKITPPDAALNSPGRSLIAPVKAPLRWPNSSLSRRCSERAAQLIARKGRSARSLRRCSARDQLLAGAGFAFEQHRDRRACDGRDQFQNLGHFRARARDLVERFAPGQVDAQGADLGTKVLFSRLQLIEPGCMADGEGDAVGE